MALGVIVVLAAMVLVYAQEMRTAAMAAANRVAAVKANAIEAGSEQWMLAQIESNAPDAVAIQAIPAEALPVGTGYFWLMHPDPTQSQNYGFGIVDEAGKLNLNGATSLQMQNLPNMTLQAADSIADWVDTDDNRNPQGAESSYYDSLPEGYTAKNSPLETIEEMLMVQGVNPLMLYGYDLNHDGVIDPNEQALAGLAAGASTTTTDPRGFFNYVTVWSKAPNVNSNGAARINVNNANVQPLQQMLATALSPTRANAIVGAIEPYVGHGGQPFPDLGTFYTDSGMTASEFGTVAQSLTTTNSKVLTGQVNVDTAPEQVLACLPGLTQSDADALASAQTNAVSSSGAGNVSWVLSAIATAKAAGIMGAITAQSYVYSADIVAVTGDGRAFKRERIVVNAQTLPATIVYRKDITSLGWPLPPDVLTSMRTGKGVPDTVQGTTNKGTGAGMIPS